MAGGRLLILAAFVFAVRTDAQQPSSQATHTLKATPKTVAWGYYDASTPPVLRIKSGDTVEVQTLITTSPKRLEDAGLPPAEVEQSLRDIYAEVKDIPFNIPDQFMNQKRNLWTD